MSKKKKKVHYKMNGGLSQSGKSKKKLNKEFKKALEDIEDMRIQMYEADKKTKNRQTRKKINKDEAKFYTQMDAIKCRKKIYKKWKKRGFLDHMIELLQEVSPFVQLLARSLATLITLFLSVPVIKEHISSGMLKKISFVFDLAMSM